MAASDTRSRPLARNPMLVHQGFWRIFIGPLPVSYKETRKSPTDPYTAPAAESVNANIRKFVCPGLSLQYVKEHHYLFSTRIPVSENNQFNKILTVNMFCDNRYENYYAIDRYCRTVQGGQIGGSPIQDVNHRVYSFDKRYRNRLTWIPFVEIHAGDDVAQEYMIWRFERCRITELSDIDITPGNLDVAAFTISMQYENRRLIRLPDPNDLMTAICVSNGTDRYT